VHQGRKDHGSATTIGRTFSSEKIAFDENGGDQGCSHSSQQRIQECNEE